MLLVNRKLLSCSLHVVYIVERPVKAHGVTQNAWPRFLCVPGQMTNSLQWVIHWTAEVHMRASMYRAHVLFKNAVNTSAPTSQTKHTCYFLITPHQQKATNCCTAVRRVVGVWCWVFTIHVHTEMCCSTCIENPGRPHLEALQSHRGFLRTAWRRGFQTMQPYGSGLSQEQAGVWERALLLVTLYVSDQILVKVC